VVGHLHGQPALLELDRALAALHDQRANFPASARAARMALALPMYPELTGEQQDKVVSAVAAGLGK
jgi:dTDP-4-amino-4,6-dideoxygalactose transaminase